MQRAFIAIGSNVGDRRGHVDLARRELARLPRTALARFSGVYDTAPVGPIEQGAYLNAAAELRTDLTPLELLNHLQAIEAQAGRPPREQRVRWGPRTLDLDIVLFGDRVISSDQLVVPHPLMHERWFVLKPLTDLDPTFVHPTLEMTLGDLLRNVEQQAAEAKNPGPH